MAEPSELKSPTVHLIREIYENDNAHELFIAELDKALYAQVDYIIIEPTRLADETGRWITVGNCLHKTSMVAGLASICSGLISPKNPIFCGSFCFISLFCTGLYTISWVPDPACKYQVEKNPKKLLKIPNLTEFTSPVVLVHTNNKRVKCLNGTICLFALGLCAFRLYESFK